MSGNACYASRAGYYKLLTFNLRNPAMRKLLSSKVFLIAAAVVLSAGLAAGGWYWYHAPKSYELNENQVRKVSLRNVNEPGISRVTDDKIIPDSMTVYFDNSLFRLNLTEDELNRSLFLTPAIDGKWQQAGDRGLRFTPAVDWLPNTEYRVRIPESLLGEEVKLQDKSFSFRTREFSGHVSKKEFYEAPQNVRSKHAVATFFFYYPLDTKNLKEKIKVYSASGEKYDFTYNLTDRDRRLHIMSSPVSIKKDADFVTIEVAGAGNAYNGEKQKEKLAATVNVPAMADFFKVSSVSSRIVRNEQKENRPEQILLVNFSTAVQLPELVKNIDLRQSDSRWCSDLRTELGELKEAEQKDKFDSFKKLPLTAVGIDQESSKTHSFRFDYSGEQRCLIARIDADSRSEEGYRLNEDYLYFFNPPEYPSEAKIAFDGALIPLNSDKSLPLVSRGVDLLQVKLAQINVEDLNHLITQTAGGYANPYFLNRYSFNEDNIAEIFEKKINVNMSHPADEIYSSLDLGSYFQDHKGIFLIKLSGSRGNDYYTAEDSRLVVITDLGLMVKTNVDGSHAVWVSSIGGEKPVAGALVEVLGKNGLPVLSSRTNQEGYALIPDFSAFRNDKTAVAYKVSLGSDVSYLPVDRFDRRLDFSDFDVGGVYDSSYQPKDVVSAYGFSDRGIYRPGESAHFGLIVRQKDLKVPAMLPLNIEIRNQNDDQVAVKNVWPDKFGLLEYEYQIPETAGLGRYTLNLRQIRNGQEYYQIASVEFNVQEFNPDTMRIKLSLDGAPAKGWYQGKNVAADVELQNLYGNPAGGHTVKAGYALIPSGFNFKEYDGYVFRDPLRSEKSELQTYRQTLPDAVTDNNGKTRLDVDLQNVEEGTYRLNMWAEGLELAGGRAVSAQAGMLVSPNAYLIGYKADGDLDYIYKSTERKIRLLAVNPELKQIAAEGLQLSLLRRDYVSSLVQMPDRTYRYQMVPVEKELLKQPYKIEASGSEYALDTQTPGSYELRLTDKNGRIVTKISYQIAGSTNSTYATDKEAGLSVQLNKKEYMSGEAIQMQISAPYSGFGLITIERDKVYAYKWFKSDTVSTTAEIVLPEDVEGNAYVNVAWIRSTDSEKVFVSPLSYAVAPFSVNKAARQLKIELSVPKTVKPGHDLTIGYKSDHPGQIILYGVNTGILQVAGYRLPEPLEYFMPKKALRVITTQILDLILPDIKIIRYLKGVGGDMAAVTEINQRSNPFARRRDKPVAFWSGIVPVNGEGGTYTYRVPENFNGEIKVMAVGVSETRMGQAAVPAAVRGDFALTVSGPYNVSPGDEFTAGVSVTNMLENSEGKVPADVRLTVGKGLEIIGNDTERLELAYRQEGQARFRLRALNELGSSTLSFQVVNSRNSDESSRISYDIGVRPANAYTTNLKMGFNTGSLTLENFVEPMFEQYRDQKVLASASPLVLTNGLLSYLDAFPHYCTEQSVSKIFPAIEIFFSHPELLKGVDVYAIYDDVIAKLAARQTLNGGFRAWPSMWSSVKEYDSLYALHFLIEAKKQGFEVPQAMFNKALSYARTVAARTVLSVSDSNPAYAAYLLTLNGEVTSNYLLKIEKELELEKGNSSSLAAAYLAAANKLLQNEEKARELIGYYQLDDDDVENARYIYLTALHFPEEAKALKQENVEALLKPLKKANFTTAQSAWSLLALNASGLSRKDDGILFNGKKYEGDGFARQPVDASVKQLDIRSDDPFYYVISQQGYLKEPVKDTSSNGLEISKEYLDENEEPVVNAQIGDEITVVLKIRYLNGSYINDVAITDMIPGCLEMVQDSAKGETDNYELREDRALFYLSAESSPKTVSYRAKVIAEGDFSVPAAFAEALYDPSVYAHTKAGRINAAK